MMTDEQEAKVLKRAYSRIILSLSQEERNALEDLIDKALEEARAKKGRELTVEQYKEIVLACEKKVCLEHPDGDGIIEFEMELEKERLRILFGE
jgi:hypothetical protein